MTPPEGEKTPLEELGVGSLEEAKTLIAEGRKTHDRTGFLARKLERLEGKLEEREEKVPETEQDSDPTIRQLRSELSSLRSTVAEMVENSDDEMKSLKPYFSEVLDEHPDLRGWQSSKTKLKAVKMFARELYTQDNPGLENSSASNRAFREGASPPVSTGPTRVGEDDLKRKLRGAKSTDERQRIMDAWLQEHPPEE